MESVLHSQNFMTQAHTSSFTDALSYRSVNIPSTRIFTINSNAEVSLDVLSLNSYRTGYASMREIVDHFFPPVGLLVPPGGEQFTDFNYWREKPLDLDDFTDSEDDDEGTEGRSVRSEDEGSEVGEDLEASYLTQESVDEQGGMYDSIVDSVEGDYDYEEGDAEDGEISDEEGEVSEGEYEDEEEEEQILQRTPTKEIGGLLDGTSELRLKEQTPTPKASPRR